MPTSLSILVLICGATAPAKTDQHNWLPVESLIATPVTHAIAVMGPVNVDSAGNITSVATVQEHVRGIMVRGIYPQSAQVQLAQDRGLDQKQPTVIDFEIQRQSLGPNSNPGKWVNLDTNDAHSILRRTAGTDDTIDSCERISPVFTRPLLKSYREPWNLDIVSHPRLEKSNGGLLFRYFDITAQPGKRYRYRVRLHLVISETENEKQVVHTRWSTPSKAVIAPSIKPRIAPTP